MVGETLRYVACDGDGEWVALVGFGSCALACRPRDQFVGWSPEIQFRRLRYVAGNQRFCVLPAGRRPNAASAVMGRVLSRLSSDWVSVWGHPVLMVETFVDPARHVGTCYGASSFVRVGQTAGYGRKSGRYVEHGEVKDVYVKTLHRNAVAVLAGPFDHPLLSAFAGRPELSKPKPFDLNTADLSSLLVALKEIPDPRDPRGIRHPLHVTLALVVCATLAGHRTVNAIAEWVADAPQEVLGRVGCRVDSTAAFDAPTDATIRRTLQQVDADRFDRITTKWVAEQDHAARQRRDGKPVEVTANTVPEAPRPGEPANPVVPTTANENDVADRADSDDHDRDARAEHGAGNSNGKRDGQVGDDQVGDDQVAIAIDGKVLRGARQVDGTTIQLLAALTHDSGVVIGQVNVEVEKTNEIKAFRPLLDTIDVTGKVVTADALHTQRDAAKLLVDEKHAHYVFGVKANQPKLYNTAIDIMKTLDPDKPHHTRTCRGHGRIDRHRVWVAPVPATIEFPHAHQYIFVERESSTLNDHQKSIETRVYVTDLTAAQASPKNLFRFATRHWSIENELHYVRDVTFNEDHSQVRTGNAPRVLASIRNLAISVIRIVTGRMITIPTATRHLARHPTLTLKILGIP